MKVRVTFKTLKTWISGISQLRHPELVKELGQRRRELQLLDKLRNVNPGTKISNRVILPTRIEAIRIGRNTSLEAGTIITVGDELNGLGTLTIGNDSWIGQYNNLRAGGGEIMIGNQCLISQFCSLIASNHSYSGEGPIKLQRSNDSKCGVYIGNDVWLGAGVVVLPGVKINDGAIVGANAVVHKDVPSNEIHAGVPARRIGLRS